MQCTVMGLIGHFGLFEDVNITFFLSPSFLSPAATRGDLGRGWGSIDHKEGSKKGQFRGCFEGWTAAL